MITLQLLPLLLLWFPNLQSTEYLIKQHQIHDTSLFQICQWLTMQRGDPGMTSLTRPWRTSSPPTYLVILPLARATPAILIFFPLFEHVTLVPNIGALHWLFPSPVIFFAQIFTCSTSRVSASTWPLRQRHSLTLLHHSLYLIFHGLLTPAGTLYVCMWVGMYYVCIMYVSR